MFDRSRTDNVERSVVAVRVVLADDRDLSGKIHVGGGRNLFDMLNGPAQFIDFETLEGERSYLAKGALRSIQIMAAPKAVALPQVPQCNDALDPYAVLGLPAGTEWETVRERYLTLAKAYHPDRFANVELPQEVADYMSATTRRVNAAFAMLDASRIAAQRRVEARQQPVYSSARG